MKIMHLLEKAWHKIVFMASLMKDRRVFLSTILYGLVAFFVIIGDLVIAKYCRCFKIT